MTKQVVVQNYHFLLCPNPEQHNSHADRNITRKHTAGIHIQIAIKPSDTACMECINKIPFGN